MNAAPITAINAALADAKAPAISPTDSEGKPRKQSDVLLDIGRMHQLFRDTDGTAYACIKVGDHHEVQRIDSSAYREALASEFLRIVGKGCNRNAVGDAVTTLSALARFNGETHHVWMRTATDGDRIVLDMGRADWRCIEVDAADWRWCKHPPMFRRAGAPLPLPEPQAADFGRLWSHINIADEHKPLVAGFLLSALRPSGPFPQLHLSGEQGSGKSTVAKVLKALVDPSASPLRSPAKEPRDSLVGALNGWCVAWDNLSFLTPQLSDALCRLSTGGAISERQLYTNADEVLIEVQRPVILNGIEDLAIRPDLADRGLHVECETITHRQSERDLWRAFDADKPYIFGALLDGVALALRDHGDIDVGPLPRMADFATWAAAGMPALGFTAREFIEAYRNNIEVGQSAGLEGSAVGRAILKLMETREEWTGTAADLNDALGRQVDEATLRSRAWPRSPRGLSGAVRRLAPAMRLAGVNFNTERLADSSRARIMRLCNTGEQPSEPATSSANQSPAAPVSDGPDDPDDRNPRLHDVEELDL